MGLYEDLLEKEKNRKEFLERTFNATQTDAVKSLLTSTNKHEGIDTRNLETYLTESGYDVSAIIAGEQTVADDWNKPKKQTELRAALIAEDEETVRNLVNSPRGAINHFDRISEQPHHYGPQTLTDEKISHENPANLQKTINPTVPVLVIAGLLIAGFLIIRRMI